MNHLLLLILGFVWGSSFILMKRGLEVFPPDQIAALRMLISCITLLPVILYRLRRIPVRKMGFIVISGIVGSGIPAFLFPLAQTTLDSSIAGILNSLTPLFTLLLGITVFKFTVSKLNVLGVTIGFIGAFFLIISGEHNIWSARTGFAMMIVLASFCYAVNTNFIKTYLQGVSPLTIASGSFLLLGPLAAAYLTTTNFTQLMYDHQGAGEAFFYIAILAVVGTALALVVFNRILQNTQPLFASSVTYLIPLFAVFWGVVDGENLLPWHLVGMVLIFSGIYLTRNRSYPLK